MPEVNRYFPRLDFDGTTMIDVAFGNDFRPTTSHTVVATLNKVLAAHSLKGGMEMRIYREDSLSTANAQAGQYAFTNAYTRQTSATGTDYQGLQNYAAFLLGMPSTTSILRASDYSEYSKTWGFFVAGRLAGERQAHPEPRPALRGRDGAHREERQERLRLRLRLRPAHRADGPGALRGPQRPRPQGARSAAERQGRPPVRGRRRPASRLYETPKNSFLPRFGFAYQANSKTVIRGGAGLFAGFLGQRRGDVFPNGWAQTTTVGTVNNAFGAPVPRNWDTASLTTPILEPVGNANGPQQGLGQAIDFFNQNPGVSKQLRYQIGFQRELPGGFVVEAAYVGNYGYDIEIVRNINALPNQYLNTDNARTAAMNANNAFLNGAVANPFAGLLPGTSFNNPTIARNQLLRPYPQFGDIRTTNNDGKSWYNSAQLSVQKRFSKGYTLGLSYTYSNWEQATEYLNAGDAEPTRMISDLDVPHRLTVSGIWELPFGKGRRFGSDASGFLNGLIGGWQIQGVYTYQTGFPIPFGSFNATGGTTGGDLFYNGGDIAIDNPTVGQVVQHRRLHVDPERHVDERDAGQPPADVPVPARRRPPGLDQQRRPLAHQGHPVQGRREAPAEGRVHQRLQPALLPQPGRRPDVDDLRTGHGVQPGELRPARPDRREGHLLGREASHTHVRGWAARRGRPARLPTGRPPAEPPRAPPRAPV